MSKADYVRRQGQTRDHQCHWPGCEREVPPAMWGCKPHWYALPRAIRAEIWRTYREGQEVDGSPSRDYLASAQKARAWILDYLKREPEGRLL